MEMTIYTRTYNTQDCRGVRGGGDHQLWDTGILASLRVYRVCPVLYLAGTCTLLP